MSDQPGEGHEETPAERDERLAQAEKIAEESVSAARLFDVRRIIGGLFVVYGIIVTIMGLTESHAAIHKSEGVNINLWTGIAMLVFGLLFFLWLLLRPAEPPQLTTEDIERARRSR